jgi:predicted DNA-binding transcriptional regulator AlpA
MEQSMQITRHVMRTPQAAEYVGLSASTLEKFRLTGAGPAYQKAGPKIVVYRPEDLDAWLNIQRRRSTSDAGSSIVTGAR